VSENEEAHFSYLGERAVWGGRAAFGLSQSDRAQHVYCLGKSGTGKSTLLRNLLVQDIEAGRGLALIDVTGDLAEELLDYIPPERIDDTVYFNPGDADCPIGLNPLFKVPAEQRHIVTSNIVGAFKGIWRHSWGVRMEYVLYAAIASLLECEGMTLLALLRLFTDSVFRRRVVQQVKDPVIRAFWHEEFESWNVRLRQEIVAPIQNKVGALLMSPVMRNILGQVRCKLSFRFMMDNSRIFIANLNKGAIGADKANLLGSLLISQMQHAAFSRADVPADDRVPFSLFVDEFQNFQTDSFATILSEARKYGLHLLLAHQFSKQLDEEIAAAVFGNVGTVISFRVGSEDAERLAREFGETFPPSHFCGLPNYSVAVRQVRGGKILEPFEAQTAPPFGSAHDRRDAVVKNSRSRFSVPRKIVENKHAKWLKS
jgi:hypothetical protein